MFEDLTIEQQDMVRRCTEGESEDFRAAFVRGWLKSQEDIERIKTECASI
jgi:hypothetical protein